MLVALLLLLSLCFDDIQLNEHHFAPTIFMDNFTLCQQGLITLDQIQTGKIYSHSNYHDQLYYLSDHHCSVTIQTRRRTWLAIESFQSNSSVSFPRCTEAKYAGTDDRLQIIDGYRNGSILRILCGKDTDPRFDRTPLILKSSIFTLDWQTKSQSFGFALRFVVYDLAQDGSCPNAKQFQCRNRRCIAENLICFDEDFCGDRSQYDSAQRNDRCPSRISKQQLQYLFQSHGTLLLVIGLSLCICVCLVICLWKRFLRRRKQNKMNRVEF